MNEEKIPNHVAIILDGNRRWAREHKLPKLEGHRRGFENIRKLTNYIFSRGVKYLSVFAFSTENFKRTQDEVKYLMDMFVKEFKKEYISLHKDNIKVINKKISNLNISDEIIKTVTIDDKEYAIDGLFIENGYTPNIDFIKSLNIKLDNNYIVVDENMKTNIDGIYASGDIIKKKVYQIVTAASDGAVAALSIIKDLK